MRGAHKTQTTSKVSSSHSVMKEESPTLAANRSTTVAGQAKENHVEGTLLK